MKKSIFALFLAMIFVSGCVKSQHCGEKESGVVNRMERTVTIKKIVASPEQFSGREVVLNVKCLGWKGDCKDSARNTRSDVAIADDTGCIYVKGGLRRTLWGKQLIVHGTVHILKGKPYIEVDNVEVKK